MATLTERLSSFTITSLFIGGCASIGGFAYGKLFHYPAGQTALGWAIYGVASHALASLVTSFIKNETAQRLVQALIVGTTGGLFIYEMRRQKLMGDHFTIFLVAVQALGMIGLVIKAFSNKAEE